MIENLVGFFSKALTPSRSTAVTSVRKVSGNPFAASPSANPFMNHTINTNLYGKNNPVRGGYFAGYYNGKPNIVGRKLFLEV